jgi:hypothetical protein
MHSDFMTPSAIYMDGITMNRSKNILSLIEAKSLLIESKIYIQFQSFHQIITKNNLTYIELIF